MRSFIFFCFALTLGRRCMKCLFCKLSAGIFLVAYAVAAQEVISNTHSEFEHQYKLGSQAFEQGQFQQAYGHFLAAYRENPGDPGVNFYLGRSAFEIGNFEAAVLSFERVIMLAPEQQRAKLELARSYYRLGMLSMARIHFQEVLDTEPPAPVRRNIEAFLAKIDEADKQHFFSGILTLGMHYDTNVLVSPANNTIQTPALNIPFVEVEDEKEDFFGSLTLALEHRYRPADAAMGWKTNAVTYNAFYTDEYEENDPDVNFFSLASGPSWENNKYMVDIQLLYEYLDKGYHVYLRDYGLQLNAVASLRPEMLLAAGIRLVEKEYLQGFEREAFNTRITLGPTYTTGANRLTARIGFERENTAVDTEAYDEYFLSLRYDRSLPANFIFFSEYRFQYRDYDGREVAFNEHRDDEIQDISVGINRFLGERTLLEISHTYTTADSTIELYEYERNLTSLSFSRTF